MDIKRSFGAPAGGLKSQQNRLSVQPSSPLNGGSVHTQYKQSRTFLSPNNYVEDRNASTQMGKNHSAVNIFDNEDKIKTISEADLEF